MSDNRVTTQILQSGDKELMVISAGSSSNQVADQLKDIFEELSPFFATGGKLSVADPPKVEGEPLVSAYARELYRLTRQQRVADETLGDQIATVGLAAYYAAQHVRWTSPWTTDPLRQQIHDRARAHWDQSDFKPDEWFGTGALGTNVAYRLGYQLAERYFAGGFGLEQSLSLPAGELRSCLR